MFDYIKCQYPLPLTEEIESDLPKQNWGEVNFQSKSLDCLLDEYSIEDDGQIYVEKYRRELNERGELTETSEGIERVEWSGQLLFYFDFFKEDHDIWIEFKALIWKGEIKEIELLYYKKVNNEDRIASQKEFENVREKSEEKQKKWWWKPFKAWCFIVRFPLFLIRWTLGWVIRFTWRAERWFTGGTFRF